MKITDFEERAARAIWDEIGGECSNDCRWGVDRATCPCQGGALSYARLALAAVAPVIEAECERNSSWAGIGRFATGLGACVLVSWFALFLMRR